MVRNCFFFPPHSLLKKLFKRYRRHRLQTHGGASCPELVFTYVYTCITSEGSVEPSHSFHRETSHLLKATPSSVFECKSKKTFFFSFESILYIAPTESKVVHAKAWSADCLLEAQLTFQLCKKKNQKNKKEVRAYWWLSVARLVEDFALKFVLMCPQYNNKKTINRLSSFTSFLKKSLTKRGVILF